MENNQYPKPHALLFAYPLQGHVIPTVHLALKLATNGFTVTFVNTKSIHLQISKSHYLNVEKDDIFAGVRKSGLDIRYFKISDGFPLEFDRSLNHDQFWDGFHHNFPAYVDELVGNIIHSNPPVTCLIADTFFVWTSMLARKYNLVNISFWTEPALVLTLYYHLDLLIKNGHFASHDNRKDTIQYIPGIKAIEPKDLMSYLQATNISSAEHRIIFKAFNDVKNADFILVNTIEELESETILALLEKQPTYAIGPIFPIGFTKSIVATSLWSESDCTEWLSTKSPGSVLYVSFGSYAHATKKDIHEIAHGLLLSNVSFIWVLRPDIVSSQETDILPTGYESEIKNKGMVIHWCCQIDVISNPAIGGFLTHCGWNSILEGIWCSLPMLCYPLLTDQFTNRKLVVDDWNIGLNLIDHNGIDIANKPMITRNEVVEKINRLMGGGPYADELRKNVKEVRKMLENALSSNGTSQRNFSQFLEDLKSTIQKKERV